MIAAFLTGLGFHNVFSRSAKKNYWFSQAGKLFWTELHHKKNIPLDGSAKTPAHSYIHVLEPSPVLVVVYVQLVKESQCSNFWLLLYSGMTPRGDWPDATSMGVKTSTELLLKPNLSFKFVEKDALTGLYPKSWNVGNLENLKSWMPECRNLKPQMTTFIKWVSEALEPTGSYR